MNYLKRFLAFIAAIVLLFVSLFLAQSAFNKILDFRKLERIPLTTVLGSTDGEVQLRGYATTNDTPLKAPNSKTECVYYRYKIEEEHRDSEGHKSWRTIRDETRAINFILDDGTAKAAIKARNAKNIIQWNADIAFTKKVGKRRYTEWRIDTNEWVTLFGWMQPDLDNPTVVFQTPGDYLPIISAQTSGSERSDRGWLAIITLAGAIAALTFMCLCIVITFAWHKVLIYLTLIALTSTSLLFHYGWMSLQQDVLKGYERFQKQQTRSEQRIKSLLAEYNLNATPSFDVQSAEFFALTDIEKQKLNSWRMSSYLVREHYLRQIQKFPESLYARVKHIQQIPAIALPDDQQQLAEEQIASFKTTKTDKNLWLNLLAFFLTFSTSWLAFRFIKVKRIQENLPTSKTIGVTYGLTEVAGAMKVDTDKQALTGPLSGLPCCWFHYVVEEKRGSGKNAKWVTIEERKERQPFICEDDEGQIRVFPSKAEIITKHSKNTREGRRRYREKRLSPGDTLYCLGKAVPDKTRGDQLVLTHDKEAPYIISNKPEKEVMMMKATYGMSMLALGISTLFFALLIIAGSKGSFSSLDYILASTAGPAFLTGIMFVILFNDMIFLRQRCRRCWANIQVSLKKRATLIPQLEKVAKGFLEHEKKLLKQITQLRSQAMQQSSAQEVDRYMHNEHVFINNLQVTLEKYPELKSNKTMQDLHARIVKLENEIAMIRKGFNDAVTQYNTRIQQIPDVFIAKMFRFERMSLLAFDKEAHSLPSVNIGNRSQ